VSSNCLYGPPKELVMYALKAITVELQNYRIATVDLTVPGKCCRMKCNVG
jgi:hypothetical protein